MPVAISRLEYRRALRMDHRGREEAGRSVRLRKQMCQHRGLSLKRSALSLEWLKVRQLCHLGNGTKELHAVDFNVVSVSFGR